MGTNVKHIFPGKQKGCLKCTKALEAAREFIAFGEQRRLDRYQPPLYVVAVAYSVKLLLVYRGKELSVLLIVEISYVVVFLRKRVVNQFF